MISSLYKTNLTAEEVESIGIRFATRYYDALTGKPNAWALRRFYTDRSLHVVAQRGRPDYEMKGLSLVGRFVKRMEYSECTVTIRSVATAARAHRTTGFTVSSVCELSRPGNNVPRKFVQSSVVERVPWTTAEYQIVETVFRYDDDTVDHRIPIAVAGKPVVVSQKRNDTSSGSIVPAVVSDKEAAGKPKGTPTNRVGKTNFPGKKSSTTSTVPGAGSAVANGKVDGNSSSPRRTGSKFAPAAVSVTGKPITRAKPVVRIASSKGEPKKQKNNVQPSNSGKPAHGHRINFIYTNRFGSLAVDEDCPLDVQVNPIRHSGEAMEEINSQSKKSKCTSTAAESNASRKQRAPEQQIGMEKSTIIKSTLFVNTSKNSRQKPEKNIPSAVVSFDRVNTLAKRDGLIVRKPAVKMVQNHQGSSAEIFGTETVHRNSQNQRSVVVHQAHTPKHRPVDPLVPSAGNRDAPTKSKGRSKKSRRNRKRNCRKNGGVFDGQKF